MGKSGHQDGVQGSNDASRALDGRSDTCTENWKKVLGVDLQEGYTVHKVDSFIYELFHTKLIWNDNMTLSVLQAKFSMFYSVSNLHISYLTLTLSKNLSKILSLIYLNLDISA